MVEIVVDGPVVILEGVAVTAEDRVEDQARIDGLAVLGMVPYPLVGQEHVVVDAEQLVLRDHTCPAAAGANRSQQHRQHHDMCHPAHLLPQLGAEILLERIQQALHQALGILVGEGTLRILDHEAQGVLLLAGGNLVAAIHVEQTHLAQ